VRYEDIMPRMATVPLDLARHELLLTGAPVPDEVLVEIVDEVVLPLVRRHCQLAGGAMRVEVFELLEGGLRDAGTEATSSQALALATVPS
jgi:hypothetical protein